MFEPVKEAFGAYMGRFFTRANLNPTTRPMIEYVARPLDQAIAWCPGRMVDYAELMLAEWQKNNTDGEVTQGFGRLPVVLVAMAKDYSLSDGYTVLDPEYVTLPDDPKSRVFMLQTLTGTIRVQVAVFAEDEPTARSIAAQFLRYARQRQNRDIAVNFCFAGMRQVWGMSVLSESATASSIPVEAKNLSILTIDLNLQVTIPQYTAPAEGEPSDGKGVPGTDDPAGYPVVIDTGNGVDGVV